MCWNPDISINTFLFSTLTLLFIYYTNTYTKYKTPTFDNPLVYLYIFTVISMQLIEYFLWKNLKNKKWNEIFSKIASVLINMQVFSLIFLVKYAPYRSLFFILYVLFLIIYFYYKDNYSPIQFTTSIGTNGHLSWNWMLYQGYENIFLVLWLLFYVCLLVFIDNYILSSFIIFLLVISLFFYFRNNTFGTIWCWSANLFMMYFLVNILFIQPFFEYNGLC